MALHDVDNPASGRVMVKSGEIFPRSLYASLDKHEEGRTDAGPHYLTREDYFAKNEKGY